MSRRKGIAWESEEVTAILRYRKMSLADKAERLNVSKWWVSRQMKRYGIKHCPYWRTGLDRPLTMNERRERYKAKHNGIKKERRIDNERKKNTSNQMS